jgi:hypothetical protein
MEDTWKASSEDHVGLTSPEELIAAGLLFLVVDSGRIVSSSYRARTMASAAGAGGEL